MKNIAQCFVLLFICSVFFGCEKYADDYKTYLNNQEKVYPGIPKKLGYFAGNLRTKLFWSPSPDPTIKRYVIKWNNNSDSLSVDATTTNPAEQITAIVPGLKEYVYSFIINSYDAKGNKSIPVEINNVRVYGDAYKGSLYNRTPKATEPYTVNNNRSVVLNFNTADALNVGTKIIYTNTQDKPAELVLKASDASITVPDYKFGTTLKYRSGYIPELGSIDTFYVAEDGIFPKIIGLFEMDKSLFRAMNLPTDAVSAYGWVMPNLWNNNPDGTGFHTTGAGIPLWFTFDLGQEVTLGKFKTWQRMSAVFGVGNAKRFEVYGTNSTPDASGSWTGWTKLMDCTSVKPSGAGAVTDADKAYAAAGEQFVFPENVPKVRYLRVKILETWGGVNYFHMMELTFWKVE